MPPFDFPNTPTVGQTVTNGGAVYQWDGVKWVAVGGGVAGGFLPLTGGTLTGNLAITQPVNTDAYIVFNSGSQNWTVGNQGTAGGQFVIWDSTTSASALTIDRSTGNTHLISDNLPLQLFSNTNADCKLGFNGAAQWTIGVEGYISPGQFWIYSVNPAEAAIKIDPGGWIWLGQSVVPQVDDLYECGASGNAWSYVFAYDYVTVSDPRYKRDVAAAQGGALDAVKRLPVKQFHSISDVPGAPLRHGFLSTDVHAVLPIFGGWRRSPKADGLESISYNQLTAVLWKAVQELSAEVDALKAQPR